MKICSNANFSEVYFLDPPLYILLLVLSLPFQKVIYATPVVNGKKNIINNIIIDNTIILVIVCEFI